MSTFSLLEISGAALSAERQRAEVVATNMANANTTRTPEGGPFAENDGPGKEAAQQQGAEDRQRDRSAVLEHLHDPAEFVHGGRRDGVRILEEK